MCTCWSVRAITHFCWKKSPQRHRQHPKSRARRRTKSFDEEWSSKNNSECLVRCNSLQARRCARLTYPHLGPLQIWVFLLSFCKVNVTLHQHRQSWTLRQRSAMDRRSRRDQLPIYFYCVNEDALVESPVALPGRSDSWPREHTYGFIDLVRKVDNMGGYFCFTFPGKYFCFTCCFVNHGYTNKIIRACGQEGKTSLKDLVCAIRGLFSLLYSLP
jgi:hypothetical protein